MYLNYDGAGGTFGDTSVSANSSNIASSAIYASVDADDPTRMVLVAINRTNAPLDAGLAVTSDFRFDRAEVFRLTSSSATPVQAADIEIDLVNAFHYKMPAMSVSTLVLHAMTTQPGDFDFDVDGRDLFIWQRDPSVGDLSDWQANYGVGSLVSSLVNPQSAIRTPQSLSVPEPTAWLLLFMALLSHFSILRCQQDPRMGAE